MNHPKSMFQLSGVHYTLALAYDDTGSAGKMHILDMANLANSFLGQEPDFGFALTAVLKRGRVLHVSVALEKFKRSVLLAQRIAIRTRGFNDNGLVYAVKLDLGVSENRGFLILGSL